MPQEMWKRGAWKETLFEMASMGGFLFVGALVLVGLSAKGILLAVVFGILGLLMGFLLLRHWRWLDKRFGYTEDDESEEE